MASMKRIGGALLLAVTAPLGAAPRTGIYTEDVDRTAQPCEDFYQYANGAWRAKNPIPAFDGALEAAWASVS